MLYAYSGSQIAAPISGTQLQDGSCHSSRRELSVICGRLAARPPPPRRAVAVAQTNARAWSAAPVRAGTHKHRSPSQMGNLERRGMAICERGAGRGGGVPPAATRARVGM